MTLFQSVFHRCPKGGAGKIKGDYEDAAALSTITLGAIIDDLDVGSSDSSCSDSGGDFSDSSGTDV